MNLLARKGQESDLNSLLAEAEHDFLRKPTTPKEMAALGLNHHRQDCKGIDQISPKLSENELDPCIYAGLTAPE